MVLKTDKSSFVWQTHVCIIVYVGTRCAVANNGYWRKAGRRAHRGGLNFGASRFLFFPPLINIYLRGNIVG